MTIAGTGRKQTSAVKFEGVRPHYTVVSEAEIKANVPARAEDRKGRGHNSGGTATSAESFTVKE